jgi:hypothetical protein
MKRVWSYVWQRKRYWLLPLVLVVVAFGALLIVAQRNAYGPFQYTF